MQGRFRKIEYVEKRLRQSYRHSHSVEVDIVIDPQADDPSDAISIDVSVCHRLVANIGLRDVERQGGKVIVGWATFDSFGDPVASGESEFVSPAKASRFIQDKIDLLRLQMIGAKWKLGGWPRVGR